MQRERYAETVGDFQAVTLSARNVGSSDGFGWIRADYWSSSLSRLTVPYSSRQLTRNSFRAYIGYLIFLQTDAQHLFPYVIANFNYVTKNNTVIQ